MRSALDTPDLSDTTTFVRWMQLGHWHADLRIPATALAARVALPLSQCNAAQRALLATQQGFCGITQVISDGASDICTWHRLVDYQPPGPAVDAGIMEFEHPDCVIETGIHGPYRERWHRLPGSSGRAIALAQPARADGLASARLFIAGSYMMRVQPRHRQGPDFDISFGVIDAGRWHIERSTMSHYEGQCGAFSVTRSGMSTATVEHDAGCGEWAVLEWVQE